MVLAGPQLDAARGGLAVELAVRAVVVPGGAVGGLPQVCRLAGWLGLGGLLGLQAGVGEVAVEDAGCDGIGYECSDGAAADPVLAAAT